MRTTSPGERIGRRSRNSWLVLVKGFPVSPDSRGIFLSSPAKVQEKPCRKGPYALRNEGQGKEALPWTWIFVHPLGSQ